MISEHITLSPYRADISEHMILSPYMADISEHITLFPYMADNNGHTALIHAVKYRKTKHVQMLPATANMRVCVSIHINSPVYLLIYLSRCYFMFSSSSSHTGWKKTK